MNKVIEVKNLVKEYKGKIAVDDLSFDVYEGEILGLLGPNGSGKSTTINSILSLLKYQKGSIKIFGKRTSDCAGSCSDTFSERETFLCKLLSACGNGRRK